jgi:HEAT repeat protein
VIAGLINAFRDEDSYVRWHACEALENMGEKAATTEVITALMNALLDEDSSVRKSACAAVEKMGEKAATNEVIAGLINVLRDEDSYVRQHACEALGNIGEKAATNEVIAGLINALRDENSDVRRYACDALGNMGEKAATNLVIVGILDAIADNIIDVDDYNGTNALEHAMYSYQAMKELDSQMLSKLYVCVRSSTKIQLRNLRADKLINLFLETENDGWLPLITYAALLQEISVTTVENKIIIYHMNEVLELPVSRPELMNSIVKAFNDQRSVLENNSLALDETISKGQSRHPSPRLWNVIT